MNIWRGILLSIVISAACASSTGAGWYTYTVADGFLSGSTASISEDRLGNLWFGTLDGVIRYDGANWRTFTTADGLASAFPVAILEDRSGNLWFATDEGVSRYDGVSWRTFTTADGLANNSVYSILEDRSGNLWFGTWRGACRYDGVGWRTFTTADGLADNMVSSILEDRSGNLWFATYEGVSRYDGVSWRTYTEADGLAENNTESILEDRSGNLWVGTFGGGVSRYDGANWRTFTEADGLASNYVDPILEDRSGNLWFGTWQGVSRYDGVSWRTFTTEDGLANRYVSAIFEDHSGNLWFGTYGGVSRYDRAISRTYTEAEGLANDYVYSILEDRSGDLWFGTYGGVSRYDGVDWQTYTKADGLADNDVSSILEDHSGNLWFGTWQSGASRYDGASWRTFTRADGLASDSVYSILEDRSGNLWFGTCGGVSRYDGVSWQTYTKADGLADNHVSSILEDRSGDLWFGTLEGGVSRYDGVSWRTYTEADGLDYNFVLAILEDRSGDLWFGTYGGVSRYDGVNWRTYNEADGLAGFYVESILEDRSGNLWFSTNGGVSWYDGVNWRNFEEGHPLANCLAQSILEDRSGDLWFACGGVTQFGPDWVPPHVVVLSPPLRLSTSTTHAIMFGAAFREVWGITFSCSFDGAPWTGWSSTDFWMATNLSDGEHVLKVKARDKSGNVEPIPAVCAFEIDATPPMPVIESPNYGQPVQDSISIVGRAADLRFKNYRVEARLVGTDSWELLAESSSPAESGVLCGWNTTSVPDGNYDLRVSVGDTLGLSGSTLVEVIVDNHAPWAKETAPAVMKAAIGGNIYTTNAEAHLYFPPHAFAQDTEVGITPLADSLVPEVLDTGVRRVLAGYEISWGGAVLEKPATLEVSYAETGPVYSFRSADPRVEEPPIEAGTLALYLAGADLAWRRIGGTVTKDSSKTYISSALTEPGRYAIFAEQVAVPGSGAISAFSITPRVFSPTGGFATDEAAISFTLGRPGPVTVKVYNRAGRLVREVVSGQQMNAGANLVRWDGRDSNSNQVEDGLYLVVVEALGDKKVETLSIVR